MCMALVMASARRFWRNTLVPFALAAAMLSAANASADILDNMSPKAQQSARSACALAYIDGPSAYRRCLANQASQFFGSLPDVSSAGPEAAGMIRQACALEYLDGPAAYADCLRGQLAAYMSGPTIPSLAGLSSPHLRQLRFACGHRQLDGPHAYARCLLDRLASLDTGAPQRRETYPRQVERYSPPLARRDYLPPDVGCPPGTVEDMSTSRCVPRQRAPSREFDTARAAMPREVASRQLTPQQVFAQASRSVYVVLAGSGQRASSQGSAVAISRTQALTNCHVIDGASRILLRQGQQTFRAERGHRNLRADACFLRVPSGRLQPVQGVRRLSDLHVGETVYTIGSPRGLENTLGQGLISGHRTHDGTPLIQTTAPVSPGSSGGGLFDARGNLIGIAVGYIADSQNLNFAIAAEHYWR